MATGTEFFATKFRFPESLIDVIMDNECSSSQYLLNDDIYIKI